LKYRPDFPDRFANPVEARAFCQQFFGWYNAEHRHSGIAWHTHTTSTMDMPERSTLSAPTCWPPRQMTFVTTMLDAGVSLRDVQIAARHADPRTTIRYDRARKNLDRHPNYILAAFMASGT
jgi:hypothetical protein